MPKCAECGKPAVGPCWACGKWFCAEHRDVRNHECLKETPTTVETKATGDTLADEE